MKRIFLFFAIACITFNLVAQNEHQVGGVIGAMLHPENEKVAETKAPWKKPVAEHYLAGAVPVVSNKVVFSRSVVLSDELKANPDKAFEVAKHWIANGFTQSQQPISRKSNEIDATKRFFSLQVEQWITFTQKALNLDRTRAYYTLDLFIDGDRAYVTIYDITYLYEEERSPTRLTAEEQITDEVSLKKGGKTLYPINGKFRVRTIQMVDAIVESLQQVMR